MLSNNRLVAYFLSESLSLAWTLKFLSNNEILAQCLVLNLSKEKLLSSGNSILT